MNKHKRADIATENKRITRDLVDAGAVVPRTTVVDFDPQIIERKNPIMGSTAVELQDLKTDECAQHYWSIDIQPDNPIGTGADAGGSAAFEIPAYSTIAVMNFASRVHCGGGYETGALAQEEDLCRTIPFLFPSLSRTSYPFGETTVLITPDVKIMRRSGTYEFLSDSDQVPVTVVSASAPNLRKERWDEERVRHTIVNTLVATKEKCPKIDTMVLGAFGCGVYGNDPNEMARIMNEVCQEYGGLYKRIVFSIPDTRGENYKAFAKHIDYFDA